VIGQVKYYVISIETVFGLDSVSKHSSVRMSNVLLRAKRYPQSFFLRHRQFLFFRNL